jgi:hypothetical protein
MSFGRKFRRWIRRTPFSDIHAHLHNRFVGKPHIINVKWLKPGEYSDRVEVLFHAVFQILVDFVEEELGHRGHLWYEDTIHEKIAKGEWVHPTERAYINTPRWARWWYRKDWAEPLGVAALDWYATLDGPDEEYPSPSQAQFGREVKELYLWYKHERDKRPSPYSNAFPEPDKKYIKEDGSTTGDRKHAFSEEFTVLNSFTPEYREHLDKCHALEEAQEAEDQAMLKRVIDVRRGLWT